MTTIFRGLETRCQFHQCSTFSFYAHRAQKSKKVQLSHQYLFMLSGSSGIKAVRRMLMNVDVSPAYSNNLLSVPSCEHISKYPFNEEY